MTEPELNRYGLIAWGIAQDPTGEYVRFADVEAYIQAAIARAEEAEAERDAALECAAIESTARAMAKARVAKMEAVLGKMVAALPRHRPDRAHIAWWDASLTYGELRAALAGHGKPKSLQAVSIHPVRNVLRL